jgi:ABC-type transporter MlaC component
MRTLSIALALSFLPLAAQAAPAERAQALIEAFKAVKRAPEGGTLSEKDRAANQEAFKRLDDFFDFDAFTDACIGPNASKLDAAQLKEVKARLVDLLRRSGYLSGGSVIGRAELTPGAPVDRAGATWVPVKVRLPAEDLSTEVSFIFGKSGKVIDLALDGDELTKDYQNQIGRIIAKGGPADLLKRLADRQKKLD